MGKDEKEKKRLSRQVSIDQQSDNEASKRTSPMLLSAKKSSKRKMTRHTSVDSSGNKISSKADTAIPRPPSREEKVLDYTKETLSGYRQLLERTNLLLKTYKESAGSALRGKQQAITHSTPPRNEDEITAGYRQLWKRYTRDMQLYHMAARSHENKNLI